MKKIINPWEGLDGYMCFGCAPNNPQGLHMEFFEDGDDIVAMEEFGFCGCKTEDEHYK